MRKKLLWIAVLGFGGFVQLQAQQDPSYTHFIYNKLMYNPAYAGASNQFCLNAVTHQQYVGYEDQTSLLKTQGGMPISSELPQNIAPKTTGAAFSAPISIKIGGSKLNVVVFSLLSSKIKWLMKTIPTSEEVCQLRIQQQMAYHID